MIQHLDRPTVLFGSMATTALVGGISGETIQSIITITTGVAAVVGVLTWLDKRWDDRINNHAAEEQKLDVARHEALVEMIKRMLAEHKHGEKPNARR
jgi:hypothetical protein